MALEFEFHLSLKINTAIFIVYGFSIFEISPGKLRQKSHLRLPIGVTGD